MMIKISAPKVEDKGKKSYLKVIVTIPKEAIQSWKNLLESMKYYYYFDEDFFKGKEKFELYYEVDSKYKNYLCTDRNDAFLVAMLHYAMATGQDIFSEAPISSKLLFNLRELLIPTLCNENTGFREIKIIAEATNIILQNEGHAGTGMSCGIDSMHTVASLTKEGLEKKYKIDVLTFIDTGGSHYLPHLGEKVTVKEMNKAADSIHKEKIVKAKQVANELNMDLVEIRSNISDIYQGVFGISHIYRNLSAILSMQSFFGKYYYSSAGFALNNYNIGIKSEPAKYELLSVPCLSTENVDIMCGGKAKTRIMKTREIVDFESAQKHLNVCNLDVNCCNCSKCYRTLLTLEILEKLDNFSKVFDLEKYKKNKWKAYYWVINNRKKDDFAREIYELGKKKEIFTSKVITKTYFKFLSNKIRGIK